MSVFLPPGATAIVMNYYNTARNTSTQVTRTQKESRHLPDRGAAEVFCIFQNACMRERRCKQHQKKAAEAHAQVQ